MKKKDAATVLHALAVDGEWWAEKARSGESSSLTHAGRFLGAAWAVQRRGALYYTHHRVGWFVG